MTIAQQTTTFIDESIYALNHIFSALEKYNDLVDISQTRIESVEKAQQTLDDVFMYRDQWSPNANHYFALYQSRTEKLKKLKEELKDKDSEEILAGELAKINSSISSMASLAGTILQIAKQTLSIRYSGIPTIPSARIVGNQNIVEVIWQGRNHSMHWEGGSPKPRVKAMLDMLESDLGVEIKESHNNCLTILRALGWKTAENVIADLHKLNI